VATVHSAITLQSMKIMSTSLNDFTKQMLRHRKIAKPSTNKIVVLIVNTFAATTTKQYQKSKRQQHAVQRNAYKPQASIYLSQNRGHCLKFPVMAISKHVSLKEVWWYFLARLKLNGSGSFREWSLVLNAKCLVQSTVRSEMICHPIPEAVVTTISPDAATAS